MVSARAHAAILRDVAARALRDARAAWRKAQESPTVGRTRGAFRACVLAARTLRSAAEVNPAEAVQMRAEARRVEAVADRLKIELARMVVDAGEIPDTQA